MKDLSHLLPKVGERIQRYDLIEQIGQGGFAVVFRAHQVGLEDDVAVKVLMPYEGDAATGRALEARFETEAKLSKQLKHPAAIKVRDYGRTPQGLIFLVSEFIEGADLSELIYAEKLNTSRIIRIMDQILGCLAEAHHRGIVHRDLKPANIKVRNIFGEPDSVKVLDFGVAKVPREVGGVHTQAGQTFGTPFYMSPEQCRGQSDLDGRADLYSLGLIMAECISQSRAVPGKDAFEILYAHSRPEPHAFPDEVRKSPLFPIIARAVQKDRQQRFPTALEMRDALLGRTDGPTLGSDAQLPHQQFDPRATEPTLDIPTPGHSRTPRPPQRHTAVSATDPKSNLPTEAEDWVPRKGAVAENTSGLHVGGMEVRFLDNEAESSLELNLKERLMEGAQASQAPSYQPVGTPSSIAALTPSFIPSQPRSPLASDDARPEESARFDARVAGESSHTPIPRRLTAPNPRVVLDGSTSAGKSSAKKTAVPLTALTLLVLGVSAFLAVKFTGESPNERLAGVAGNESSNTAAAAGGGSANSDEISPLPDGYGVLNVETNVVGATVQINGETHAVGQDRMAALQLPYGDYDLQVSLAGYRPHSVSVNVSETPHDATTQLLELAFSIEDLGEMVLVDGPEPFYVSRQEFSLGAAAPCLEADHCLESITGAHRTFEEDPGCHLGNPALGVTNPLNCVSYSGAVALCRFYGLTLVSNQQWSQAAYQSPDLPHTLWQWTSDPSTHVDTFVVRGPPELAGPDAVSLETGAGRADGTDTPIWAGFRCAQEIFLSSATSE